MRIKQYERTDGARHPSSRPRSFAPGAASQTPVEAVTLSREVRAFSSAMTRDLPPVVRLLAHDLLTPSDRALLTAALELAEAEGLDVGEVTKLAIDLTMHRMLERGLREANGIALSAGGRVSLALAELLAPHSAAQGELAAMLESVILTPSSSQTSSPSLALPRFVPADESLARAILASPAMRDAPIDRGFLRALLEPSLRPMRAVSLAFVQRLIAKLTPSSSPTANAGASPLLAAHESRVRLAEALTQLDLPHEQLVQVFESDASDTLSAALLSSRAIARFGREPELSTTTPWRALLSLSRNDRTVLRLIYAAEHARGRDLGPTDDLVMAVVRFRASERAASDEPAASLRARQAAAIALARLRPANMRSEIVNAGALETGSPARSFGSVDQVAERLFGTFRQLAPARVPSSVFPSAFPPPALDEATQRSSIAAPSFERASLMPSAPHRSLDLAQALGLSTLVAEAETRARRARRLQFSRRRPAPAPDEHTEVALENDLDGNDPERRARRRARWRTFLSRKPRARD